MYSLLGWLNVVILGILITPYVLKYLNKKILKSRNSGIKKAIKFLRILHKPLGLTLAVVALIHGYLALGSLRLHTGSILYVSIIITAVLGGSFYKLKKKILFTWHKIFALISLIIFMIHLFYPNAIYYLLN
ncbi:MAG: hypothetical protein SCJ93_12320 [Bacillota bacterium]|nr:hypothetical protein [Bacillota bacterium]